MAAGCSVQFYGGNLDSVFEVAGCSAVGPPDGTITPGEKEDLIDIRNRQLEIVLAATAPNLTAEARASLARRIIEAKGKAVREGEWEHSIDDGQYASHILGSDSRRDFKPVKAEHERRFGAQR